MEKFIPSIGTKLYLSQRTGCGAVDEVKTPYTVIGHTKSTVTIQSAKLIFNQERFFDTLPDAIEADPEGDVLVLHWSRKHGKWQVDIYKTGYPDYAFFGNWEYYPYID